MSGATHESLVEIVGPRGTLRGVRHSPSQAPRAHVVILQGFFSSTHIGPAKLYVQIARRFAALGFDVLRVDPCGVGDSDGDFEDTTFDTELADYRAMLEQVSAAAPTILVGHSLGASMAIHLAAEAHQQIVHALLVSPACGPFTHDPYSSAERAELTGTGRTLRKGTPLRRDFVDALESEAIYDVARRVRVPSTIVYGSADEFFDRASIERLRESLVLAPPELVIVEGADHNSLVRGARASCLSALDAAITRVAASLRPAGDR